MRFTEIKRLHEIMNKFKAMNVYNKVALASARRVEVVCDECFL